MRLHLIDADVVIYTEPNIWIVNLNDVNTPIIKIPIYEYYLIKNEYYKHHNCVINVSDNPIYLSNDLYKLLKIKSKYLNIDISNIAFSYKELIDDEYLKNMNYIYNDNLTNLLNVDKGDKYYILCKYNKKYYKILFNRVKKDKKNSFLNNIDKIIFLSKKHYNYDISDVINKKMYILFQYMFGFKIKDGVFTNNEINDFDEIVLYESDKHVYDYILNNIYNIFKTFYNNSDEDVKRNIQTQMSSKNRCLTIVNVNGNRLNGFDNANLLFSFSEFQIKSNDSC